MDNDNVNATIINPSLPSSVDGLLTAASKIDSVHLSDGRVAINNGVITTVDSNE